MGVKGVSNVEKREKHDKTDKIEKVNFELFYATQNEECLFIDTFKIFLLTTFRVLSLVVKKEFFILCRINNI